MATVAEPMPSSLETQPSERYTFRILLPLTHSLIAIAKFLRSYSAIFSIFACCQLPIYFILTHYSCVDGVVSLMLPIANECILNHASSNSIFSTIIIL
ncbi:hypothetical protein GBAR_LOCUS14295, partial [Geodia barretti]